MSYNKFAKSNSSKLGFEIIRAGGLTSIMQDGALNSIPVWEMLNITEEQYVNDYEWPAFAANQAKIDAELKAIIDASGLSVAAAVSALSQEESDKEEKNLQRIRMMGSQAQ